MVAETTLFSGMVRIGLADGTNLSSRGLMITSPWTARPPIPLNQLYDSDQITAKVLAATCGPVGGEIGAACLAGADVGAGATVVFAGAPVVTGCIRCVLAGSRSGGDPSALINC